MVYSDIPTELQNEPQKSQEATFCILKCIKLTVYSFNICQHFWPKKVVYIKADIPVLSDKAAALPCDSRTLRNGQNSSAC
jgi:hypothetical protein